MALTIPRIRRIPYVGSQHPVFVILFMCLLCLYPIPYHLHKFVYDDDVAIVKNADITNTNQTIMKTISAIFDHDFWGQKLWLSASHKSFRPLVTLTFAMEFRFWRKEYLPGIMKATNAIIHFMICILLYFTLNKMFPRLNSNVHVVATLLFALHPIHVEAIFSVVGRADLMCALFYLLTVYFYTATVAVIKRMEDDLTSKETNQIGIYIRLLVFSTFLASLSVLSKEIGITVLPFCVLYDIISNVKSPRVDPGRNNLSFRCTFVLALAFLLSLLRWLYTIGFPKFGAQENPLAAHPDQFVRILSSFHVAVLNAYLLIYPQWLCCDWSHNTFELIQSWHDYRILFQFLLFGVIFSLIKTGNRDVITALAWIIVSYIPASHILHVGFVLADRLLYIPSIGFCVLVAIGFKNCIERYPKASVMVLTIILSVHAVRFHERARDWETNYNLFKSAIEVCPNSKMYANFGQVYAARKSYKLALKYNLIAHRMDSANVFTIVHLGNAYRHLGDIDSSIEFLERSVELAPEFADAWMNLGLTYTIRKRYKDALAAFIRADQLNRHDEMTLYYLSNLYEQMGLLSKCEEILLENVEKHPESNLSAFNLLVFYVKHGPRHNVQEAFDKVNVSQLRDLRGLKHLSKLLIENGHAFEFIQKVCSRILELDPMDANTHFNMAIQYKSEGMKETAIEHLKSVYMTKGENNPHSTKLARTYDDLPTIKKGLTKT